jgi:TonB family protein
MLAATVFSIALFCQTAVAQQGDQLSLADFLIGLRSKKVTLEERNKLLTEAAKARGVTFTMTPEIEKELENTGADKALIDAIRSKATIVKISAPVKDPTPATPPPPDHSFYQKRAVASAGKGDLDSAIADFTKAIEVGPAESTDFVSRGMVYYTKKSYDLAIADLDKAISLKPNDSTAYVDRGFVNEKMGNSDKALADFKKAYELDSTNESASLNLKRLQDEKDKADAAAREKAAAQKAADLAAAQKAAVPESISMGQLTSAQATKMVMPVYSDVARKANIEGKVTVYVTLDTEGNVIAAKAESGHPFLRQAAEDAAKKSKFKPALFGTVAVKGSGFIVYNFTRNVQ